MTAWTALFIMIFFACIIALDLICCFFGCSITANVNNGRIMKKLIIVI